MSQTIDQRVNQFSTAERRLYEAFRAAGFDVESALTATDGHREQLRPGSPAFYRQHGLSESTVKVLAQGHRSAGLSESAARIIGARPGDGALSARPPAASSVGRTDADWSRVREAARRCGAQARGPAEHLSDDERKFHEAVIAHERRGLLFAAAVAAVEAAVREQGGTR